MLLKRLYFLLIVPYGIETENSIVMKKKKKAFNRTLWNWNPAAIAIGQTGNAFNRTLWNWNMCRMLSREKSPYTFNRTLWNWNFSTIKHTCICIKLLIVPYGIETGKFFIQDTATDSFNRTLWNWNSKRIKIEKNVADF